MTGTSRVLRAAIVGTGRIGNTYDDEIVDPRPASFYQGENRHIGLYTVLPVNHASAYASAPGYKLVAAANRSPEKLSAFGERRGVTALYRNFQEMARQEQPDVVSVCTRSEEKADIVIGCAELGVRAIVVEKAMACSLKEADTMLAACERNGVLLAINHPYRFSRTIRRIKRLIDEDAIGPPGSITAHAPGGMLHVGSHVFDLMRYWCGDVVSVYASIPKYEAGRDLPARGIVEFENGVTGFFDHTHGAQPHFEVRGRDGFITISTMVGDGWIHQFEPMYGADAARKYPNRLRVEPIVTGMQHASPTLCLLMELRKSLVSGSPFISTGQDGAAALEIGIACHLSHREGGPVSLPLRDRDHRVYNR